MRLGVVRQVAVWIRFADPAHDVDVSGEESKFEALEKVARGEGEQDGQREAEPEVGGGKEEVVVSEQVRDSVSWCDYGVDDLTEGRKMDVWCVR